MPERERRCAHGATRPDRACGDALSGDSRERETATSESSDRYDLVTVRFTLSADCSAFRELFCFWADFRSVRLWAGRWLAARGAAELFVVLFVCPTLPPWGDHSCPSSMCWALGLGVSSRRVCVDVCGLETPSRLGDYDCYGFTLQRSTSQ